MRARSYVMKDYFSDFDRECDGNITNQIRKDAKKMSSYRPTCAHNQWLSTAIPGATS